MANGFLSQSPEALMAALQQQQMQLREQARQQRASNPMTHAASSMGNLLGRGAAKLFGMESSPTDNPMYKKAVAVRDITTSVPQDDPEYYVKVGKRLADAGFSNEAQMAINKHREIQAAQAEANREERKVKVDEAEVGIKGANLSFKQGKWKGYLKYLYDALAQQKEAGGARRKMAEIKTKMWEDKAQQTALKEWAAGQGDPSSPWNGVPYEAFTQMGTYEKMDMLSSQGLEDLSGFINNDKWLQRLIVGQGALTHTDQGNSDPPKTPGGKDYFADIPD